MTDLYTAHHEGLIGVHRALADAFAPIAAGAKAPLDVIVPQARGATSFLLAHHDMESKGLFPGLRRYGRLRSSDVAFLDACDREHHTLHTLCERLIAATRAPHPSAATIAGLARETLDALGPHTREEEEGLAPTNLCMMVTVDEFTELGRELEAMRARALARLAAT